jgi:hypothetical protein
MTILDHSGAISSLSHWTQFIPKVDQRWDTIVVMVTSVLSRSPTSQREKGITTVELEASHFGLIRKYLFRTA